MLDPIVIGIAGNKTAGKTFCAEYMAHHYKFRKYAYADSVKGAMRAIFGFTDNQLSGYLKEEPTEEWGFSPRWAMQFFGTQCMRGYFATMAVNAGYWTPEEANDVWVKSLDLKLRGVIESIQERNRRPLIVIDDVRFRNEFDYVKSFKHGYMAKVLINGQPLGHVEGHASETGMRGVAEELWDWVLVNEVARGGHHSPYTDAILKPLREMVETILVEVTGPKMIPDEDHLSTQSADQPVNLK